MPDDASRTMLPDGLEIEEDLPFQRQQWTFQHISWIVMAVIIVLALMGLFGPGPLSSATVSDADRVLTVDYNRFEQTDSGTELRVRVAGDARSDSKVRLWIDRSYLQSLAISEISPTAASVEQQGARQIYTFQANSAEPFQATIRFEHSTWGRRTALLGLDGGPEVRFTQTVYP